LNEPLKKDLLVDPASNFQTSVCLPKISVNRWIYYIMYIFREFFWYI
jgi:hypothetical protein